MFGRAGRNGCSARAHLLYTNRQAKQMKDVSLQCFASEGSNENCRRKAMLTSLGSRESVTTSVSCCDICSGQSVPSSRLDVLVPIPLKRATKPKPVRHISNDMEKALRDAPVHQRDKLIDEFPGYKMYGQQFFLSQITLSENCVTQHQLLDVGKI